MAYSLSNKSYSNILLAVILAIGIASSILVFALSYYDDEKLRLHEFNEEAENRYSALKREIDINLGALKSVQALYYASENIGRAEFRKFTGHILMRYEDIQSLEWLPRVPDSRRTDYESSARREGFPDFQLTERIAQGKMKRAEKRKEYFPVYFIEPYKGNEIALGFDLASDPAMRETMEAARRSGETTASAKINLLDEDTSHSSIIVFAPIFSNSASLSSDQARWDNLKGFSAVVFRISTSVEESMSHLAPAGIDFIIYDTSAPGEQQLLYSHSSRARKTLIPNKEPETGLRITKILDVGGRKWTIIYSAAPEFIAAKKSWYPWGFLLAGLLLTGLVSGSVFIIVRNIEKIEKASRALSDVNTNLKQEIIEREKAETELFESEARLRTLVQTIPDLIWLKDTEGVYLACNKMFERFFGAEEADIIGKTDYDFVDKDLADFFREHDRKAMAAGKPSSNEEWITFADDGHRALLDTIKTPMYAAGGRLIGVLGIARDITERNRAEEIIESLHRTNKVILDSVGEGIFGIDLEDRTTFINPAAANMLGIKPEDILGKMQHAHIHHTKPDGTPYPMEDCPVYAVLKDGTIHYVTDEVFWKKDGTSFPVEYSGAPIVEDGRLVGAVVVFKDVTERKHAEKEIKKNLQIQNILNSLLKVSLEGIPLKELLAKALDIVLSVPFLPLMPKGGIFLVGDEPEVLILTANRGLSLPTQEICARVPFGKCLCGRAAASRQIQFAACMDERHENSHDGIIDHGHYNVPILSMGKVLGVLVLYLQEGHQQEESELEFLQAVANAIAGIIERKQLENALRKFNEELTEKVTERTADLEKANAELKKLVNAVEQTEELIVITDVNGAIEYVNPAFTRKTGYSREEALGKNPRILQSGLTPIELYSELWKAILSGNPWTGTFINRKKSGELYYEDAAIAPVVDEHGKITHFVAAKTDVTDRIMAEKELKRKNIELELAKETAESANRAKSEFLASMSHELRTPLNSILGFSEILRDGMAGPMPDKQKELLNDIATSGRKLLFLINDILDLSKAETGQMELEPGEFNLEQLIKGVLVMLKEKAMKHNIKLAAEVEAAIGNIIADERKIKRILFMLLSNAVKFTPEGGSVRVAARKIGSSEVRKQESEEARKHGRSEGGESLSETSALPRFRTDIDFIEISVTDTGIGIAPEDQEKLFQPFQQIDAALSRKYSGTGLGLNLCRKLVELHGGRIRVESEPGKGSRFIVVIPIKQAMAHGEE